MGEITEEAAELVARVAALDIGKASLVACVRVPHERRPGRRRQEVRSFATTTRSLLDLLDWLVAQGVTLCGDGGHLVPTCDMRVHEFKWEALLEVRLMPRCSTRASARWPVSALGVRRG